MTTDGYKAGTKIFVSDSNTNTVEQYNLATPFDISTLSQPDITLDISDQETSQWEIAWNYNGTKLYISGVDSNGVLQYDLDESYDLSTATYDATFNPSESDAPWGVAFNPDGTRLWLGDAFGGVYEYDLSTAWDVTTASYTGTSFDPGGVHDIAWGGAGSTLFVLESGIGGDLTAYDCGTPYDVSTATAGNTLTVSAQDDQMRGMAWSPDGTRVFTVGVNTEAIYQYNLSTAWDLSTASLSGSAGISNASPYGLALRGGGAPAGYGWSFDREFTTEPLVWDIEVNQTLNPFGTYAIGKMDDVGGQTFEQYSRGTRVDVAITEDGSEEYINPFTGYTVESREREENGADVLEVEAFSFDQFLRRNQVANDLSGMTISAALEDIITTDTPVAWNAANVTVGDDQELTRPYQGEQVELALRDLAFKSEGEEFGVSDDLEFYFRPREISQVTRGIDNTQWKRYDIPELGKDVVNEVEVWFDDGDRSVIVDSPNDKLDLEEGLDLPDTGTQRGEINRPAITNIDDAESEGEKYLEFRNATLSGTVTTYGLFGADPGDVIDVEITPRGIDAEFRIAAINYQWLADETTLTIVENRDNTNNELLYRLTESVDRIEMEGADRDAPKNRVTNTTMSAEVAVEGDIDGTTSADAVFTNDGANLVREAWAGRETVSIDTIAVGTDGSDLSRTNTALQNLSTSDSASVTLVDPTTVEFSDSVSATPIEEVGLFDGSTLVARAVFDDPLDTSNVAVTLSVSDGGEPRGVITDAGQTAIRDILADNSPTLPSQYAYGTDQTDPTETDTALGNQVFSQNLDEIVIQSHDATAGFAEFAGDIPEDTPLFADGAETGNLQIGDTRDAQLDDDGEIGNPGITSGDEYNSGAAVLMNPGTGKEYQVSFDHTVPAEHVGIRVRDEVPSGGSDVSFQWDGVEFERAAIGGTLPLSWRDVANDTYNSGTSYENAIGDPIDPGETYTLTIENDSGASGSYHLDVVYVFDEREEPDVQFPNPDAATNGGGVLDGPEEYSNVEWEFQRATTRRDVTQASATSAWDDTSNGQYIDLAIQEDQFVQAANSTTASVSVSDANAETDVQVRVGFSRHTSDSTTIPATGDTGQRMSAWELVANPAAVARNGIGESVTRIVVPPGELDSHSGDVVEAGVLAADGTLLTRGVMSAFDIPSDMRISSSETNRFGNP